MIHLQFISLRSYNFFSLVQYSNDEKVIFRYVKKIFPPNIAMQNISQIKQINKYKVSSRMKMCER